MITAFGLRFISPWHAVFQTIGIAFCLLYPLNASAAPLKVFWCNDGEFGRLDGAQFAKLKSADLDGSNVSTIRTSSYTYMRGCHYDSIVDKLFLVENDYDIYRVAPDNSSSLLLQTFISGSPLPHIIGSIVLDARDLKMYWPENKNWQILRASSSDPLVTTSYPYKNEPEAISLSPGTEIRTPFDIEIDWLNHNLYFANYGGSSGGSIGKVSLDDFTSETIVVTPREAVGIAVDPIHRQIFYTLDNNDIWTASLDGGNQTNLTPIIGPAFKSAHRRMDIDYDIETDKIYWIENSNPFNVGLDGLAPGKLRRANPDGTNVEDVVSDVGYYATFLSLKYGTLSAELDNPVSGRTYVTDMRLSYSLAEPPNPGTISVKFKQGATTKASLTMKDSRSITTTLNPLSSNADPGAFASATSGFPLAEGSYTVELSYQDIPGNPAFTTSASNVVLAHPTATPTTTPTLTSTPTSTPTATVTPTITPTATVGINQVPTATPTPILQCISSLKKAKVRVKDRIATVSLSGKKGGRYRVLARFLGKSNSKPKVVSITAAKNGALHAAFGPLKKGSWEFSYSITLNKLKSMSCSTQKNIR